MTAETLVIASPGKPAGINLLRVLLGLLLFFMPAVFCILYLLLPTSNTFYLPDPDQHFSSPAHNYFPDPTAHRLLRSVGNQLTPPAPGPVE